MAAGYAALVSLMNVIHDLQHHPPPISIHHQSLQSITQHIIFFLDFLQDYRTDDDEESADPLEMRIANAAYEAEDAIETHIVDTIQLSMEPINANDEKNKSINLCRDRLQTVIKEMDSINNFVVDLKEKMKMAVVHGQVPMKNVIASVSRVETMVGLDAVSREIMEKLTRGESHLQVTPIVGMGGIGKTFLAKSIYEEPLIKDHFDICAWATISQQYNTIEIFSEILSQATKQKKEGLSGKKSEHELGDDLRKYLFGRRFLIVLDDMWSAEAWDMIRRFFPNNKNGSRVLVTTRLSQLSSQLNQDYSLHMSFLDEATTWDLFSRTVFGDEKSCPLELKEIGEQIAYNCRGLPLSIVLVGGLLKKTDETRASWKSIRDNLSSIVTIENDKHCLKLLKMSYNHLPVYLKPCFLYMGVFKEDEEIRVSMLLKLWVLEGFIKPSNGEAMEKTAREFMQELIGRNLILIHSLGVTGKIKYCKIHDLVRSFCLVEGQKGGLFHVVGRCNQLHPQEMNTLRRVVIPMDTSKGKEKVGDDQLRSMPNVRSVICQYGDGLNPRNLRLLRTLHAYDMHAFHHFNLRHLAISVRQWDMSSFSHLVSTLLWNLQTLIVSCWEMNILPSDFWKMPQFRHVEFVGSKFCLPDIPSDEGDSECIIMENLLRLKGVSNFKCCEGMVKRIPILRKLKLHYMYEDEGEYFLENIKSLCRLESLHIEIFSTSDNLQKVTFPQSLTSYNMQKLSFPQSLKKLCLWMSVDFEWEYLLEKIGSLPLLEKLRLGGGCFGIGRWETVEGQFPCLKYLVLESCKGLENWTAAEEGSSILPRLEYLYLGYIKSLKQIPLELGNIDTLKEIELFCWVGEALVKCAKEMVDEQVESQGELCFHVLVTVRVWDEAKYQRLKSLAGPHIEIGLLPLLGMLDLWGGCFRNGKWETVEGQFPCLKDLTLGLCVGLENWTAAEEGSSILPRLEHLDLEHINSLKEIPLELGSIDTLKEIQLLYCGDEAVRSAKAMVDEQVESQGQLCFHVRVTVQKKKVYQRLKNLAGPHFEICRG